MSRVEALVEQNQVDGDPSSVFHRFPELDVRKLPFSLHVHKDEWEPQELKVAIKELLGLHIRRIELTGVTEDLARQMFEENGRLHRPINTRVISEPALSEAVPELREIEEHSKFNSGSQIYLAKTVKNENPELAVISKDGKPIINEVVDALVTFGEVNGKVKAKRDWALELEQLADSLK